MCPVTFRCNIFLVSSRFTSRFIHVGLYCVPTILFPCGFQLGDDSFGHSYMEALSKEGIDTKNVSMTREKLTGRWSRRATIVSIS